MVSEEVRLTIIDLEPTSNCSYRDTGDTYHRYLFRLTNETENVTKASHWSVGLYHYKGNSCKPASASQALRHRECDYMGGGLRVSGIHWSTYNECALCSPYRMSWGASLHPHNHTELEQTLGSGLNFGLFVQVCGLLSVG